MYFERASNLERKRYYNSIEKQVGADDDDENKNIFQMKIDEATVNADTFDACLSGESPFEWKLTDMSISNRIY